VIASGTGPLRHLAEQELQACDPLPPELAIGVVATAWYRNRELTARRFADAGYRLLVDNPLAERQL